MFIELTDHLRCPETHPEQYLVLLPGRMEGRQVLSGELGCPVCGKVVALREGVVDFGGGVVSPGKTSLSAEAVAAFLGLAGPGGFIALIGGVASVAANLAELLPGIGLVLVNSPESPWTQAAGILKAARLPIKQGSLRGVVVGADFADASWVAAAAGSVLPGLRVIGEGGDPPEGIELLARSGPVWVAVRALERGRKP